MDGTKFKVFDKVWEYDYDGFKSCDKYKSDMVQTYLLGSIAGTDFELIEDTLEGQIIDIDKIVEIKDTNFDILNMTKQEITLYHNLSRTKINELVQAVKQLSKRIEELEKNNDN